MTTAVPAIALPARSRTVAAGVTVERPATTVPAVVAPITARLANNGWRWLPVATTKPVTEAVRPPPKVTCVPVKVAVSIGSLKVIVTVTRSKPPARVPTALVKPVSPPPVVAFAVNNALKLEVLLQAFAMTKADVVAAALMVTVFVAAVYVHVGTVGS